MKNKKSNEFKGSFVLLVITLVILTAYFVTSRFVPSVNLPTVELIVLIGLLIGLIIYILLGGIRLIVQLLSKKQTEKKKALGKFMITILLIVIIIGFFVRGSQWRAHTPVILSENGEEMQGSISSLEKVKLGGVDQWLIIRGHDVKKPVLLFLSGGPGASEAARVIRFNQELEKHFVVVIWEQRGCGKSYPSLNPKSALTVDQYVSDLLELTNLLRTRFDEEKIYLVGHSWGTIIGAKAAQQQPELFHAYVGTAQMVNVLETDQLIYDMVLDYSIKTNDTAFVKTLEKQGVPPYYGKNPIKPYSTLFGREYAIFEVPNIKNEEYRRDGDVMLLMLKQPEYGWLDRVYYLLGLVNTFNVVYPQLQDMDLRVDGIHFDIPVYLVLGGNDMNNPPVIPEEYYELIQAPHKQLIIFEEAGHGMIWEEAQRFHDLMINQILPETYGS